MTKLTNLDREQIAAILLTHAELQDQAALRGSAVLARLRIAEPRNPLTLAMADDLKNVEDDCLNLQRLARIIVEDNNDPQERVVICRCLTCRIKRTFLGST